MMVRTCNHLALIFLRTPSMRKAMIHSGAWFLLLLIGLNVVHGDGQVQRPPVKTISSKVALMCYHEPYDPSYYQDLRKEIYEQPGLRAMRGFHRLTGIKLDEQSTILFVPAYAILVLICIAIFIGFVRRPYRKRCYALAFCGFIVFLGLIYLYTGLARLNQMDIRDAGLVQKFPDIFSAQGVEYDIISDWKSFKKKWDDAIKGGHIPWSTFAWAGVPEGAEPTTVNHWIDEQKDLPLFHMALGAHLPIVFHEVVFGGERPELSWNEDSAQSVCERSAAYGRKISWRVPGEPEVKLGVFNHHQNRILYGSSSVDTLSLARVIFSERETFNPGGLLRNHFDQEAVLRLDDPGTAQNHYVDRWTFRAILSEEWQKVADHLKENHAEMTVAVIPGWLDDGDASRGKLIFKGQEVEPREPLKIYPSKDIIYKDARYKTANDIGGQFKSLTSRSEFDIQLHGHTHMSPDIKAWSMANDRYESYRWYREFLVTETSPFSQRPAQVQHELLSKGKALFLDTFSKTPLVLVPPGHKISYDTAFIARGQGLKLMSDGGVVLLEDEKISRSNAVVTRNLWSEEKVKDFFDGNFTCTYLLHDRDLRLKGIDWLDQQLKRLRRLGVKRFMSLNELAFRLHSRASSIYHPSSGILEIRFRTDPVLLDSVSKEQLQALRFRLHLPHGTIWNGKGNHIRGIQQFSRSQWLVEFLSLSEKPPVVQLKLDRAG